MKAFVLIAALFISGAASAQGDPAGLAETALAACVAAPVREHVHGAGAAQGEQ